MLNRRALTVLLGLVLAAASSSVAFAAKGTPLTAQWLTDPTVTQYGVFNDSNGVYYANGVSGVQCYFGVSGKDLDLVTYNTPRTLKYNFNSSQTAWQLSGIPASFNAVSDLYGVNYFGPYKSQSVGSTAQVNATLQFYVGTITYELQYQSLASYRVSATTWLITSYPNDPLLPAGNPGFTASNQAALSVVRRKSQTTYGTVNMPIRFYVTLQ